MALRVSRKYNSVLYSYIGWLIDELFTPSPPPHPLAYPQTAPIGIEIGYRGRCLKLAVSTWTHAVSTWTGSLYMDTGSLYLDSARFFVLEINLKS